MPLSHRLELRQSQALVMTPQLQQAIKLLQLSNLDLNEFVEGELERNPLLEAKPQAEEAPQPAYEPEEVKQNLEPQRRDETDKWLLNSSDNMKEDPSCNLDSRADDVYPDLQGSDKTGLVDQGWSSVRPSKTSFGSGEGGDYNFESFVSDDITLQDHLLDQLQFCKLSSAQKMIGAHLIDLVDEQGYLRGSLEAVAMQLGTSIQAIEEVLGELQSFEPTGVCARDLSDCMRLQLIEQNRFDPAIEALLENINLLASHNFAKLKKVCNVADEDLADMIAEIKNLNPKPENLKTLKS